MKKVVCALLVGVLFLNLTITCFASGAYHNSDVNNEMPYSYQTEENDVLMMSYGETEKLNEETICAKVGEVEYTNYIQAWQAVQKNGGTIDVLSDWVLTGNLEVFSNKTITVNMNGHNIRRNLAAGTAIGSGQVFLVRENAELIINGGTKTTEHKGTLTPKGVWVNDENGTYSLYGGLISGGSNGDGGGGIHIQKNGKVTLNSVTLAGKTSLDDYGAGGVRLQHSGSELILNDSRICYNIAEMGGGGGIRMEGENSKVTIKNNSSVDNNRTTRDNSDGGGIQINGGGSVTVDGTSQISYNTSARRGGGVYVYNGSLTLEDGSNLMGNVAKKEGGAVYIDEDAKDVKISADFIGNRVLDEEGGAIYVNNEEKIVIENSSFTANTAKTKGGAIYVDGDDRITLAGKCETYQNMPNNIYLMDDDNISSAQMTAGSSVGIFTDWDATSNKPVKTSYNDISHFYSDKIGFEVAGESGKIYYTEASEDTDTSVKDTYIVDGVSYELKNGTFTYNSDFIGNLESTYFYSDGYFAKAPTVYNEHLSTMSICMAMTSATSELGERPYTELVASENIRRIVEDIGYKDIKINYPKPAYFGDNANPLSTIGYTIANKNVILNNSNYTIISMTVRSSEYKEEWASNVTIGDGNGDAEGFSDAAAQIMSAIEQYIADYNINTTNVKFWISGYSRGGATANIVSKRLTDIYGSGKVYGYTFEAPLCGVKNEMKLGETYLNIHNIVNKSDPVVYIAPEEMGFIRYGHDVYVPGYSMGTEQYESQKVKMLAQLAKLNTEFKFDDYFHPATIEYVFGTVGDKTNGWIGYDSLVVETDSTKYDTAEKMIPFFVSQLMNRSITDEVKNSEYNRLSPTWKGFRHCYSDYKWYLKNTENGIRNIVSVGTPTGDYSYVLTFEQAVANALQLVYSLSDERVEALMKCFDPEAIMKKLDTTHIWWTVVRKWDDLSYKDRNEEINDLWNALGIEGIDESILTNEEKEVLRTSLPVILDVLLDFLSEDYDHNDQVCIGSFIHNISNLFQPHFFDIVFSWLRSYDSFYECDYMVVPSAPETDIAPGIYGSGTTIKINKKEATTYYYTLDGTTPSEESNVYVDGILLSVDKENTVEQYTIKVIAVKDGISSEVSTFAYIVSDVPVITCEQELFKIYNLDEEAIFIVAGYSGEKLNDVKIIPLSQSSQITLASTGLDTSKSNTIKAFLWKDLQTLLPLCRNIEMSISKEE